MRKLFVLFAVGTFLVATSAFAGSCNGQFGWLGKGTVYGLGDGDFIFTGEFSGAFFNEDSSDPTHNMTSQCPGLWHVKGGEGASKGVCILKDAAGDKMVLEWAGTGTFPETGGPFTIVSGSGKFAGASGSGMFKGVSVAADDMGNGMGYATWWDCNYTTGN